MTKRTVGSRNDIEHIRWFLVVAHIGYRQFGENWQAYINKLLNDPRGPTLEKVIKISLEKDYAPDLKKVFLDIYNQQKSSGSEHVSPALHAWVSNALAVC